jgi:hypothetical protein
VKGAIPSLVTQGYREASLRTRGKGTYSLRGIQATAHTAWESVKRQAIRSLVSRSRGRVDNCRGASGPERGYTIFARGMLRREAAQELVAA